MAITNGMVHIVGAERAGLPVAQVAAAAYFDPSVRSAEPEPPTEFRAFPRSRSHLFQRLHGRDGGG